MLAADSLIMHDRSSIKFSYDTPGILKATIAIVGSKCEILSRDENGLDSKNGEEWHKRP
ncbi:hypothetical protein [Pontibacter pudoricolor]|uniref:hypothetical protein n=1 Tax=Pontibacter pudoricolor TaxID=2694930 RepID=UPI0013909030|nr:hypothetical protein [Pontibacter pudoricolor]